MSNYPAGVTDADIDFHFGDDGADEPDAHGNNHDDDDEPEWLDHRGLSADDAHDMDMALVAEGWRG